MKKPRQRRATAARPRGRPRKPTRSKAVAFRLPPDVIALATTAATDRHISRNKLVELVLRQALEPGGAPNKEVDARHLDLFS